MSLASADASAESGEARYILITQCLQNDFFFSPECRLALPERVVHDMLLSKERTRDGAKIGRTPPKEDLAAGPLGIFLDALLGEGRKQDVGRGRLDVLHVRDWHKPSPTYDAERRTYGAHCEGGTWGAAYLSGLEHLLDPEGEEPTERVHPTVKRREVWVHQVFSDSVFDFKPCSEETPSGPAKLGASSLEDHLDKLIGNPEGSSDRAGPPTYLAVIGVYTDIKVQTLLVGLRTRYNLTNLVVSDTLTASATLQRHIGALDYATKVLGVEVVHGVNDLVRFLGGSAPLEEERAVIATDPFSRYSSFLQDKQNVLAYENERLRDYLLLTEERAIDNFKLIERSNRFLIAWGSAFLLATLVLSVLGAVFPDKIRWELALVTGGLSLLQVVSAFFSKPIRDLHQNLTNLAVFKMILESHSLKAALARFHLTTPQTLRELSSEPEADAARRQVMALEEQIAAVEKFEKADYEALERLGFRLDAGTPAAPVREHDGSTPAAPGEAEQAPTA